MSSRPSEFVSLRATRPTGGKRAKNQSSSSSRPEFGIALCGCAICTVPHSQGLHYLIILIILSDQNPLMTHLTSSPTLFSASNEAACSSSLVVAVQKSFAQRAFCFLLFINIRPKSGRGFRSQLAPSSEEPLSSFAWPDHDFGKNDFEAILVIGRRRCLHESKSCRFHGTLDDVSCN